MANKTIKNLDKLSPVKRDKIKKGLLFLDSINKEHCIIDKVVVFGSVVNGNCSTESDIDICLYSSVGTENDAYFRIRGGLADVMDDNADILSYRRLNDHFKDIVNCGVVVYE